jgi:hypothetical protein
MIPPGLQWPENSHIREIVCAIGKRQRAEPSRRVLRSNAPPQKGSPTMHRHRLALALLALAAVPAAAHHSWSGSYDLSRSERIEGVVARVAYQSPHSAIHLDVKTQAGGVERWTAEWGSPTRLRERGVTEKTIRPGDAVLIHGNPNRDPAVRSLRLERLRRPADGYEYP